MKTNLITRFQASLYLPKPAIDIAFMRIALFSFFIFKLLSRDYSVFGLAPKTLLNIYPYQVYPATEGFALLGLPFIVHLASFHWIHWFLPFPSADILGVIQWVTIGGCLAVILFGRGPKHMFAILAYVLLSYLWGYNWRSSGDIDAVFIPFQLALVYCFFKEPEALILGKNKAPLFRFSRENGWFYAMALLVFCSYYFYAGFNKLMDLAPWHWGNYQLIQSIAYSQDKVKIGFFSDSPAFFSFLAHYPMLNFVLVPLAYLMELTIPLMFFNRHFIATYWLFFTAFHITTWAVGILFLGELLSWWILIPVHRIFQRVTVVLNEDALPSPFLLTILRLADVFKRLTWINLSKTTTGTLDTLHPDKSLPQTISGFYVTGHGSPQGYTGFHALKRLLWALPVFWVFLPFFYLPGLPLIGEWMFSRLFNCPGQVKGPDTYAASLPS